MRKLIVSLLQRLNIKYSRSFEKNIPSSYIITVAAITGILDKLKIPNLTIRLKPNQLSEITFPAIAHCQTKEESYFVLLQSFINNQVGYYQEGKGEVIEALETFAEKWSGMVMLLVPDENSAEPNYEENRQREQRVRIEKGLLWATLGVFVLVGVFLQTNFYLSGIFLLYGIGTVVSILLLQGEYGHRVEWVEKLCSLPVSNGGVNKVSCDAVTLSSGGKIFGFSWAEIGLVYFGGSVLSSPLAPNGGILPLLSFMALLYVPFSLYYQAFVVRTWCTLCLIVQGIFVMIAVAWLGYYDWHFLDVSLINGKAFMIPTAGFTIAVAFWLFFKQLWQRERQLIPTERELEHWQNDSDLFLSHLYAQPSVQMNELPHEDQVGNPEAPIIVTMVSNPHCNPCKDAYKELSGWVKYFEDEMQLRIRHINSGEAHYQLHEKWAKEVGIEFTPTLFINGYRLRSPYSHKDVWKHIRALADEELKTNTTIKRVVNY